MRILKKFVFLNFQGLMTGWSEKVNYRLLSIKQDCYRKKSISDMTKMHMCHSF